MYSQGFITLDHDYTGFKIKYIYDLYITDLSPSIIFFLVIWIYKL